MAFSVRGKSTLCRFLSSDSGSSPMGLVSGFVGIGGGGPTGRNRAFPVTSAPHQQLRRSSEAAVQERAISKYRKKIAERDAREDAERLAQRERERYVAAVASYGLLLGDSGKTRYGHKLADIKEIPAGAEMEWHVLNKIGSTWIVTHKPEDAHDFSAFPLAQKAIDRVIEKQLGLKKTTFRMQQHFYDRVLVPLDDPRLRAPYLPVISASTVNLRHVQNDPPRILYPNKVPTAEFLFEVSSIGEVANGRYAKTQQRLVFTSTGLNLSLVDGLYEEHNRCHLKWRPRSNYQEMSFPQVQRIYETSDLRRTMKPDSALTHGLDALAVLQLALGFRRCDVSEYKTCFQTTSVPAKMDEIRVKAWRRSKRRTFFNISGRYGETGYADTICIGHLDVEK